MYFEYCELLNFGASTLNWSFFGLAYLIGGKRGVTGPMAGKGAENWWRERARQLVLRGAERYLCVDIFPYTVQQKKKERKEKDLFF